jgi:hypothetical protein
VRQRAKFLASVARISGGYTLFRDARGMWCDRGRAYRDVMTPVSFSGNVTTKRRVVGAFHAAFPDQLAAMVSRIGTAQIVRFA